MRWKKRVRQGMCLLLTTLLLAACSGSSGGGGKYDGQFDARGYPVLSDPEYKRTPPAVRLVNASGQSEIEEYVDAVCEIDTGNAAEGYVAAAVNVQGSRGAFFQIEYNNVSLYSYPLRTDGQLDYYPLVRGSGTYTFSIWVEVEGGGGYAGYMSHTESITVADEFAPFLVPNKLVNYTASSAAVAQSYQIAENCANNLEVVQMIYRWICDNITYDTPKAENISALGGDYVPDIDAILRSKTGICYDYASLAAAMLRANGIPTKLVMGDADTGEGGVIYHAWNEVYLEETGWIAVKLEVSPGEYTRIDTTFAAGSDDSIAAFIGDGSNYSVRYYH